MVLARMHKSFVEPAIGKRAINSMNDEQKAGLRKIHFTLEPDEDGYPPCAVESVWGKEDSEGNFVIQNIPFFVTDATLHDVVAAAPSPEDGVLEYKAMVRPSANSLLRVVYYDGTDPAEVWTQLEELG